MSKNKSLSKPRVMFSCLGDQARAAAINIVNKGILDPWATLDYHNSTGPRPVCSSKAHSIEDILAKARRQEPLSTLPRLSDLDIFHACPGLIYCLDYMQNRLYDGLITTYEQRRAISTYIISFWSGELSVELPDLVISQSAPHEVVDYALFILCLWKGIPWITLQYNPWGHRPVWLTSDSHGNLKSIPIGIPSLSAIPRASQELAVQKLLATLRQNRAWDDRHDMKAAKQSKAKHKLFSYFKTASKAALKGLILRDNSIDRAYLRWLDRKCSPLPGNEPLNLNEAYIYFPLNYQPELTTCPLGGMFCDQLLAIRAIASALPAGWFIYVKEHPAQFLGHSYGYLGRTDLFYDQLKSIPQVRLVPADIHSQLLIDACRLVATLTGSVGYEALARSKCVLVFGDVWYGNTEGCFRVAKPSDIHHKLFKALNYTIAPQRVESDFLQAADQSLLFFGESSTALSYGYTWDVCQEQACIDDFLHAIPTLDLEGTSGQWRLDTSPCL